MVLQLVFPQTESALEMNPTQAESNEKNTRESIIENVIC